MNYHYLDASNQPAGPASPDEIRALSQAGTIARDPMICPVGGSDWKLMSAVTGTAPAAASTGVALPFSGTILADFVGRLAKLVGGILSPALIERVLGLARHLGQYAVLAGGALGLIASIILAIQNESGNSFGVFLGGVMFVIVVAVAQYTASRFLGAAEGLIRSTPSRLSSMAFLECLGVLTVLAAVGALLGGTYVAIQAGRFSVGTGIATFVTALVVAAFLACYGAIALHPKLASVEAGEGSAGEEAIGILAFGLKAALKLVPLAFALFAVVGALALFVSILPDSSFKHNLLGALPSLAMPPVGMMGALMASVSGMGTVICAALIPMFGYFAFLLASLPLELWRAILSLPGKLDMLRRAERAA